MYSLKDDRSIKTKGADKGEAVIVWNREDYLKEVGKELKDKEVHGRFQTSRMHLSLSLLKK